MPHVEVKTNLKISKDTETSLKSALAESISLIPGKSERWLMISLQPETPMYFAGSDAPCALFQVQVFGSLTRRDCDLVTSSLTENAVSILGIPASRVYVKYEECSNWGWNGSNF